MQVFPNNLMPLKSREVFFFYWMSNTIKMLNVNEDKVM